jgi:glycosyltransferase involved in cell wall biosynthesis
LFFNKKILFISHESALSGAPRSLLYFLEWLKINLPTFEIHTLVLKSQDPINNAFQQLSDFYFDFTSVSNYPEYSLRKRLMRLLTRKTIVSDRERLLHQLAANNYDLIYANTVVSLPIALELRKLHPTTKVLLHVHEMATAIQQLLPSFENHLHHIDYFIAASELVKEHLVTFFGCAPEKISRVYECSDIHLTGKQIQLPASTSKKVIMIGGAYWAKGDDVFLLVAKEVIKRDPSVHFYWLGGMSLERLTVNQGDIIKLEIQENVHFLKHTDSPHDVVKSMDILALTSRSDSFPLAAIEAGLLGLPIVCFEKASGIQEIIANGGGEIVPYLDIHKMADAIINILNNHDLKEKYASEAKSLFQQCKPDVISSEIAEVLQKIITGGEQFN